MPTTTQVGAITPRNNANGTTTTPTRAIPVSFDSTTVQINCTSGNPATPFSGFAHPFNDPAMQITFGIKWSWDTGATFPDSTEGIQHGSPTGTWGTTRQGDPVMTPSVTLGMPSNSSLGGSPNAYQAYMTVSGGPITFGLTVLETTG